MNDTLLVFLPKVFFGFFAIMNPIANTPIFMGMTEDLSPDQQKRVALKSVTIAFMITAVFAVAGRVIFNLFGLTLPAFRIAGGILIFSVGWELLRGQVSRVHTPRSIDSHDYEESRLSIAVSPLGIPILAGPGTISTAMNFTAGSNLLDTVIVVGVFSFVCVLTYLLFVSGQKMVHYLGESFLRVISRVMGLILAVIGTEMAIVGIQGALKRITGAP